jgi:hypothetical protein
MTTDEAILRFHLKSGRVKTKGIHFAVAEAIANYGREYNEILCPDRSWFAYTNSNLKSCCMALPPMI